MKAVKDYEELLKFFNKHKVKYCIVGAFALAFHAKPRYTKDMDILVEASLENGKKIIAALTDFGFESLKLSPEDFTEEKQVIQLGYEPVRVDLLTSIDGVGFASVWKHKVASKYGHQKAYFIGLNELMKNKQSSDRLQDKADLKVLDLVKEDEDME
jgi:hypothetical protein